MLYFDAMNHKFCIQSKNKKKDVVLVQSEEEKMDTNERNVHDNKEICTKAQVYALE